MKKVSLLCIFLLNLNSNCFANTNLSNCKTSNIIPNSTLTLDEIISIGLCRNPITASAYYATESARAKKNASYSGYMPEIDLSTSYGMNRKYSHPSNSIEETSYETSGSATISANYLIFDFGKREANINQMTALWKATDFNRNNTVQNYIYDLISAYYNVLMTDSNEQVAKKLLDVANESKEMSETKFKAGVVAKIDVLRAETTRASRELDYQKAITETKNAKGKLLYLLNYSQNQDFSLDNSISLNDLLEENKSVDKLIEEAIKNRPDLKSAIANTEIEKAKWDSATRSRLPSISGYGNYTLNDSTRPDPNSHGNSGSLGIKASIPLFSGLSLMYNQRSAKQSYLESEENLKNIENQIALDVWTAYQNYKTSIENISTTKTLLESATETERSTKEMYKVGRATMLDWQITQSDFADAEYQAVYAKYDYFIKKAALALSIGDLYINKDN